MRVIVLGCGPAGLIAAQAARDAGAEVAILSKPRKSFMKGAQYLHRPIPNVDCGDPFEVEYLMTGSPAMYRTKVYGEGWDGTVSPEDLAQSHMAWDIRKAYDRLWDRFSPHVLDWEANKHSIGPLFKMYSDAKFISSIPAPLLCKEGHTFRSTSIWSTNDEGLALSMADNTVLCNGEESPRWYRAAKIQGNLTIEWPGGAKPPVSPLWEVPKPLDHNCTCFPNIVRVGRYGSWKKGILSHEAYEATTLALQAHTERLF